MNIAIQPSVALKRCPFCGISPVMTSMFNLFMVRCPNCEAEGGMGETEIIAANSWNRRTPEHDAHLSEKKSAPEHQVDMLMCRMVLNEVVIPAPEQAE